jgi:hypothetical protein
MKRRRQKVNKREEGACVIKETKVVRTIEPRSK